jgi:hypothetical protein
VKGVLPEAEAHGHGSSHPESFSPEYVEDED